MDKITKKEVRGIFFCVLISAIAMSVLPEKGMLMLIVALGVYKMIKEEK